ncbi:lysophospholipid acyltransferase family protein [Sporanaerobacter acetigenes]|uniref:1-acyl-sn-glycerol-3-phosphate acyltransferase n=1 Tax=Sporanaerobacter acetigenes DSM 13106 TaxID=1123281 RepID=A0A1M5XLY6_9FIRM|nr:lysophospholipid acyltransferase family protein [Sporanaerobacter acetigenes]SHI00759.1 1-acyl-sn-glycerol-3-phosphate acyltransferase [Sporanaerobacter acetigenes DSM 13106]
MLFYKICYFIGNIIFRVVFRFKVTGKNNIPKEGRVVICANHTSNFDPLILALALPRQVHYMAKKELFNNAFLKWLFTSLGAFPVDREAADLSAIRTSVKILQNEKMLGIFPEGTRVYEENLELAKPGVGLITIKGKAPVVPVFMSSKYKPFSKVNITIGEPINFHEYYNQKLTKEDYKTISQKILKSIYSLK